MDNTNRQVTVREFEPSSRKDIITAELMHCFVTFRIHGQAYGLPLEAVERAVLMAAVTPIPDGPTGLLGLINIEGHLAPVLDVRRIFGLPSRAPRPTDRLIIMTVLGRKAALVADELCDVLDLPVEQASELSLARSPFMVGTVHHGDEVIFLLDPNRLLSMPEYARLPQ